MPDRLASRAHAGPAEQAKLRDRLGEIMAAADSAIVVAEEGGQVIGLAEVYAREDERVPARVPRRFGYLQSMVISEAHRRKGSGRLLLSAAETWALGKGCAEMRLDIWEFPAGPLNFYQRFGYRTLRRTLVRELK